MHCSRLTYSDSELTVIRSGCSVESKQSVELVAAECCVIRTSMSGAEYHTEELIGLRPREQREKRATL